nr:LysR substrate-binding domain-containing protein [Thaumasiovibrio subtropicus]
MNIETKWLQDFLTLAERRNFSQAAVERNVTQPAFSRRIRALEGAMGTELIDRSKSPIELTPAGKQFRITARSIMSQVDEEISRLAGLSLLGGQAVQIAAAHSVATNLLPDIQIKVAEKTPEVTLNVEAVDVDDAIEALQQGECDILLAFHNQKLLSRPYQSHLLDQSHLHLVSATAQGTDDPLFNPASDVDVPLLAYSPGSFMGREVQKKTQGLKLKPVFSSSMSDLIKALVLKKQGVAWLPHYAIKQELANHSLTILSPEIFSIPIALYAYRYDTRLHPAGEKVWELLVSEKHLSTGHTASLPS